MRKIITHFRFALIAILFCNIGLQSAKSYDLSTISYDYLAQLPYGTGVVEVYKNGAVLTPNGSMIGYKTNLGNIGVLEMEQLGEDLKISWITYNNDKTISSQTLGFIVTKNTVIDLDKGFNYAANSKENEFKWVFSATSGNTSISFFYGTFFKLPASDCFANLSTINSISEAKIKSYPIWKQDINATDYVSTKTKIIYQTNEGRYGIMEIVSKATDLVINWITYETNGNIYSTGCNKSIGQLQIFDLDMGNTATVANFDIQWIEDDKKVKWIYFGNNAKLALLPNATCETNLAKLKEITKETIKSYSFTDTQIDGSENNNQLKVGTRVAFHTADDRFGIFKIVQYGEDLLIDRITYDDVNGVYSWGCFEKIQSTYAYDLNNGNAVNLKNSDMFWFFETLQSRYLIPKNGTKFYQIDQPITNVTKTENNKILIFPNPAKHEVHILDANSNSSVTFYDPLGKQMVLQTNDEGIVNLEGLKAGLYQINYSSKGSWKYAKLNIED